MKNYVQNGDVLAVTAGGTVNSGDVVLAGSVVGVAINGGVSGDVISVSVKGVYNLTKNTTDVVARGAKLYWDAGNSRLTVTPSTHEFAGYAWAPAGNGDTKVDIRLIG